jgi:hypothetical protein
MFTHLDIYTSVAYMRSGSVVSTCRPSPPFGTSICDEFVALQQHLAEHPSAGDLIPHSGGCRKLRWGAAGRGKRGGTRVIYFLRLASGQIVLVTMCSKNVREDVDPKLLRRIKEEFDRG